MCCGVVRSLYLQRLVQADLLCDFIGSWILTIDLDTTFSYLLAYNLQNYKFLIVGGVDGARTRDPRRDRPVF